MRQKPVGRDDAQAADRRVSASHGNGAAASRTQWLNPRAWCSSVCLCVMVLVTIIAVSSSSDDADSGSGLPSKISGGGNFFVVQFVVKASSIDNAESIDAWKLGFEQDLAAALNDNDQGLPSLRVPDPDGGDDHTSKYATELVVHEDNVAVGS